MANLNIKPNALFTADNLYVLNGMNSACIDLIYLDPPFNSKRLYKAPVGSKAAGAAFEDMWSWKDVDSALMVRLSETHPFLVDYITAIERIHSKAMMAYIAYMAQRLFEMHRVLKSTGSIYLHCDPTASHYLKVVMDRIFGAGNFRNEVVWKRTTAHSDSMRFGCNTDTLLFYSKGDMRTWNVVYTQYTEKYLERFRFSDPDGRKWQDGNLSAKGLSGGGYEYEFEGVTSLWRCPIETMQRLHQENRLHFTRNGGIRLKCYLDEAKGLPLQALWDDIAPINSQAKERTGYPTQKPLALLERIIKASSNEGDVVLDPFCGCATTCVAAQQAGRRWIGIDLSDKTEPLIRERLTDDVGAVFNDFTHYAKPPTRGDVKRMTKQEAKPILYGAQEGNCAGCGEHFEARHLEVDHEIPCSKGGGDYLDNYQLMCGNCNRIKGNRPMEYLLMVIAKRKAQRAVFGATPAALNNA